MLVPARDALVDLDPGGVPARSPGPRTRSPAPTPCVRGARGGAGTARQTGAVTDQTSTDETGTDRPGPDQAQASEGVDASLLDRAEESIREAHDAEGQVAAHGDITTLDDERAGVNSEDPGGEGGHP